MNKSSNYSERYASFLNELSLTNEVRPLITNFLESNHSDNDIDQLLMSMTKKLESFLREKIQEFEGSSEGSNRFGVNLLEYAAEIRLLEGKKDPLYSLIYWIFKNPRNSSHHEFKVHPFEQICLYTLQINEAIYQLVSKLKTEYEAKSHINLDPSEKLIKIQTKIFKPDQSILPSTEKVEANLEFSNKKLVPVDLRPRENGEWYGKYNYKGNVAGTLNINYRGFDGSSQFNTTSGPVVIVPSSYENCPRCGTRIVIV